MSALRSSRCLVGIERALKKLSHCKHTQKVRKVSTLVTNRDKTVNQGKALPGEGENRLREATEGHSPKTHRDSTGSRRRERHARNSLAILRKTRPMESGCEKRIQLTNRELVFGQK